MSARAHPQVILVSIEELRAGLNEVRSIIPAAIHQKFELGIESLRYLQELIAAKDSTLRKLRQLIFGEESERLEKVFPQETTPGDATAGADAGVEQTRPPESGASTKPERAKGHGRNGASDYAGAERIKVPHPELTFGCACPHCQKGKVYQLGEAGQILRIVGGPLLQARLYEPERGAATYAGKSSRRPCRRRLGRKSMTRRPEA